MDVKEAGKRGGLARRRALSAKERSDIARIASLARWAKWRKLHSSK